MSSNSSANRLIPVITASTASLAGDGSSPGAQVARSQLDDQIHHRIQPLIVNRFRHSTPSHPTARARSRAAQEPDGTPHPTAPQVTLAMTRSPATRRAEQTPTRDRPPFAPPRRTEFVSSIGRRTAPHHRCTESNAARTGPRVLHAGRSARQDSAHRADGNAFVGAPLRSGPQPARDRRTVTAINLTGPLRSRSRRPICELYKDPSLVEPGNDTPLRRDEPCRPQPTVRYHDRIGWPT